MVWYIFIIGDGLTKYTLHWNQWSDVCIIPLSRKWSLTNKGLWWLKLIQLSISLLRYYQRGIDFEVENTCLWRTTVPKYHMVCRQTHMWLYRVAKFTAVLMCQDIKKFQVWCFFSNVCLSLFPGRWSHTGSPKATPSAPLLPNRRQSSLLRWLQSEWSCYFTWQNIRCVQSALACLSVAVCRTADRGQRKKLPIKGDKPKEGGLCPKGRAGQMYGDTLYG